MIKSYSNLLLTSVSQYYILAFRILVHKFPYSPSGLLNWKLIKTEEKNGCSLKNTLTVQVSVCSAVQPQSCSPVAPTSTTPTEEDLQLGLAIQIQSSENSQLCNRHW